MEQTSDSSFAYPQNSDSIKSNPIQTNLRFPFCPQEIRLQRLIAKKHCIFCTPKTWSETVNIYFSDLRGIFSPQLFQNVYFLRSTSCLELKSARNFLWIFYILLQLYSSRCNNLHTRRKIFKFFSLQKTNG